MDCSERVLDELCSNFEFDDMPSSVILRSFGRMVSSLLPLRSDEAVRNSEGEGG